MTPSNDCPPALKRERLKEKFAEARLRLPLRRCMEARSKAPANGNWKTFPRCPYCGHKDCAGLFKGSGGELFKCHHVDCPSGTQEVRSAWNEVGFLAYELRLSRREAFFTFLKEAGVELKAECPPPDHLPSAQSCPPSPDLQPSKEPSPTPGLMRTMPCPTDAVSNQEGGAAAVPPAPTPSGERASASPASPPPAFPAGEAIPFPPGDPASSSPPADGATPPDDPPAAPPAADGPEPINPKGPRAALRYFYARTRLTDEDMDKLWRKRALSPETARMYGLRSSLREYEQLLTEMARLFPIQALLDASLYVQGEAPGSQPVPNKQYFGWGVVGRSQENPDEWAWGWTFPVLIPYLDEWGEVVDLRPHKRTQKGQAPRLYIPRPLKEFAASTPAGQRLFVVVCEGEFKALALAQALGDMVAAVALPGITLAKQLGEDLVDLMLRWKIHQGVVAYDNEEKGDPDLPSYQENAWERYNSEVWARYLANLLYEDGLDGRVAHLPDEWRDEKAKADWDGAMARLVQSAERPARLDQCEDHWQSVRGKVRSAFFAVLRAAVRPLNAREAGWFPDQAENLISLKLQHISHKPKLPEGGSREKAWSRRLFALCKKLDQDPSRLPLKARESLWLLAQGYGQVSGRYYERVGLEDKEKEFWNELLARARAAEDAEVVRAIRLAREGHPKVASSFVLRPLFFLINEDGDQDTVLEIWPVYGAPSKPLRLPWLNLSQPVKFREFVLRKSGGAFHSGEKALSNLQEDVSARLTYKVVHEVPWWGHYVHSEAGLAQPETEEAANGIYFFGDMAFGPDGRSYLPDKHGVFWIPVEGRRRGFLPSPVAGQGGQEYRFSVPKLRPQIQCSEPEFIQLAQTVLSAMRDAYGGPAVWLAMGITWLQAASPEFFDRHSGQPNLWVHGPPGEGKSSLSRVLMRMWGYPLPKDGRGIDLKRSTAVGLQIVMGQYANLPVWGDEYQTSCPEWVQVVVKSAFDRTLASKWTKPGEKLRRVRAGLIVSGVATSGDPQVRLRYVHTQVSVESRRRFQAAHGISEATGQELFQWLQDESQARFFLFGRFLMQRRRDFAALVMDHLGQLFNSPAWADVEPRSRQVYGGSYAAVAAFNGLWPILGADELRAFHDFAAETARQTQSETQEHGVVGKFWHSLTIMHQRELFGVTAAERRRFFFAEEVSESCLRRLLPDVALPRISEDQLQAAAQNDRYEWHHVLLFMPLGPVLSLMNEWRRSQGLPIEIQDSDLLAQMSVLPYFVRSPDKKHGWRKTFEGGRANCICVAASVHPDGYLPIEDEAFRASFPRTDEIILGYQWNDPRKGELFALIDSLRKKEGGVQAPATHGQQSL